MQTGEPVERRFDDSLRYSSRAAVCLQFVRLAQAAQKPHWNENAERTLSLRFSDSGNVSTVNDVFASGDRRSPVGCEESNQFGDFLRPIRAAKRNSAERMHQVLSRCSRVSFRFLCESLDQSRGFPAMAVRGSGGISPGPVSTQRCSTRVAHCCTKCCTGIQHNCLTLSLM